jgi:hypothetical protein
LGTANSDDTTVVQQAPPAQRGEPLPAPAQSSQPFVRPEAVALDARNVLGQTFGRIGYKTSQRGTTVAVETDSLRSVTPSELRSRISSVLTSQGFDFEFTDSKVIRVKGSGIQRARVAARITGRTRS